MSSSSSVSEPLLLRPHHGLCIGFFEGKGYSDTFVQHMDSVIGILEDTDPLLRLTVSCDVICGGCPHNRGGVCDSEDKVAGYDKKVLSLCGLHDGAQMHFSAFRAAVRTRILDADKLRDVCGSCAWAYICSAKGGCV